MTYTKPASAPAPVAPVQNQATPLFSDFQITLINKDSLRAMASCKIAGAVFLNGIRVVEGSKGLFISMPSRKDKSGEYQDVYYPANREIRQQLQENVLSRYQEMTLQQAA
jgi:stage V sporulation protein G